MTTNFELQQGLNEVVNNKVHHMINTREKNIEATISRLINEGNLQQDYIAPIGVNLRAKEIKPTITFTANENVIMRMPEGEFILHDNAVNQIAEKMNIPPSYLRNLAAGDKWKKELCSIILNEHSGWTQRSRVLIRAVGSEVRAVQIPTKE